MFKKPKQKINFNRKKLAIFIAVALVMTGGGYLVWVRYLERYSLAADAAEMVSIRELILRAAEGIKTDAPVDPKTGDIYFPQARLYLPSPQYLTQFTYSYDAAGGVGGHEQLNISTKLAFGQRAARLYSARNINEMFEVVPQLQSCQRGIAMVFDNSDLQDPQFKHNLKQTITLNNGKILYMYLEDNCPELSETLGLLKNLRSY
jgi:hypothetical protein